MSLEHSGEIIDSDNGLENADAASGALEYRCCRAGIDCNALVTAIKMPPR